MNVIPLRALAAEPMINGRGWMSGLHLEINPLKRRSVDDVAVRARGKDEESVLLDDEHDSTRSHHARRFPR